MNVDGNRRLRLESTSGFVIHRKTRLDTRPPFADGWAVAEMHVFPHFDSWVTDRLTDGWTDGRTGTASETHSVQL